MREKVRAGYGGHACIKPRDQKSLKISSYFSLFGCLCGSSRECEDPGMEI